MWVLAVWAAVAAPEVLRFESGFRVVVDAVPEARWTATTMVFDTGEADVPEGQEQLVHLLEHVWFRAGAPTSYEDVLSALGCESQAFTWPRSTEFLSTCPPDVLDAQLDLEAARLMSVLPGLDAQTVAIERDIVALEIAAYREASAATVLRTIAGQLDPDSAVRRRLVRRGLGERLDLDSLRAFASTHWTPERAVLAIVSPRTADELRLTLSERFGPVVSLAERGPPPDLGPARSQTLRVDVRKVRAPVEKPLATVSWELPSSMIGDGSSLMRWLELALARRIGIDDRFRGLSCFTNLVARVPAVTCIAELREDADPVASAQELRNNADVREEVSRSLVELTLAEGMLGRLLGSVARLDSLSPTAFNRPSRLAYGMLRANRVLPLLVLPGDLKRRDVKRLQRTAIEAFDPQRALVIAVTPHPEPQVLPAARPVPVVKPVELGFEVPPPVRATASLRDVPGGVAVLRPDLTIMRTLTFSDHRLVAQGIAAPGAPARNPQGLEGPLGRVYLGPQWPLAVAREAAEEPWVDSSVDAPSDEVTEGLTAIEAVCALVDDVHGAIPLVVREIVARRAWDLLRANTAWTYTPDVVIEADGIHLRAEILPDAGPLARTALAALAEVPTERELAVARRRASLRASSAVALPSHWTELFQAPGHLRTAAELRALPDAVAEIGAPAVAPVLRACAVTAEATGPAPQSPPR